MDKLTQGRFHSVVEETIHDGHNEAYLTEVTNMVANHESFGVRLETGQTSCLATAIRAVSPDRICYEEQKADQS